MIRRLASLHWLQQGAVRRLQRYYQDAMTSCRPSRRASLPLLDGTSVALAEVRSSADECAAEAWSWSPGISGREFPRRRQDLPSSWGISIVRLHVFLPTPAGLLAPDHYGAAAWPLDPQMQRLPRKVFRRPIAWLSDSLSTLRSAGYPDPTQDSLPAVGQTLLGGLSTRRVPMKGFRVTSSSSSPKLYLTQCRKTSA